MGWEWVGGNAGVLRMESFGRRGRRVTLLPAGRRVADAGGAEGDLLAGNRSVSDPLRRV